MKLFCNVKPLNPVNFKYFFFFCKADFLDLIMPLDYFFLTKIRFSYFLFILTPCQRHMIVINETWELMDVRQIEVMQP